MPHAGAAMRPVVHRTGRSVVTQDLARTGQARERTRPHRSGEAERWRRTWKRMRAPWAAVQVLLCATAAAFAVLWLELPDGSVGERVMAATVLLVACALALWIQAAVVLAVRRPVGKRKAWRGALFLLELGLVYGLLLALLHAGALQDGSRAAYLENQTFLWHVASAGALLRLEHGVWWLLRWGLAAAMLPLVMECVALGRQEMSWRCTVAPLRERLYWATVLGVAALWRVVSVGTAWFRPAVALPVQVLLTAAKLGLLFVVGVGGLCLVLSMTGTYLRDWERAVGGRVRRRRRGGVSRSEVLSGAVQAS